MVTIWQEIEDKPERAYTADLERDKERLRMLGLKRAPDRTTLYRTRKRLSEEYVRRLNGKILERRYGRKSPATTSTGQSEETMDFEPNPWNQKTYKYHGYSLSKYTKILEGELSMKRIIAIAITVVAVTSVIVGAYMYAYLYPGTTESPSKEFFVGFVEDITTGDPHKGIAVWDYIIAQNTYNNLVAFKEEDNFRGTEVVPELAKSWETPDTKTYIFHLREDVKFQDGTPFNATAAKYSIDRSIGLYPARDIGTIIDNVEVIGTYTVKVSLKETFAPFLSMLCHIRSSAIVSPTAVEKYGDDFWTHPAGTGPFIYDHWTVAQEIVLVANEEYFMGPPKIDKLICKVIPDASTMRLELEKGSLDFVPCYLPSAWLAELEADPNIKTQLFEVQRIRHLMVNNERPPFTDVRIRKAIAYAIDYDAVVDFFVEGLAKRIYGPLPPNMWGYDEDIQPMERNITRAKELLTEAGYPDGFETSVIYAPWLSEWDDIAVLIQDNLKDIGINVRIDRTDLATVISTMNEGVAYEMCMMGHSPRYPDPDGILHRVYYSDNIGYSNRPRYSNPVIDALIEEARGILDVNERTTIYKEIQRIIIEDQGAIWLFQDLNYSAMRSNVKDVVLAVTFNYFFFKAYKE